MLRIWWDKGGLKYIREYLGIEKHKLRYTNNSRLFFAYSSITHYFFLRTIDLRTTKKWSPLMKFKTPHFYQILLQFLQHHSCQNIKNDR